jgi:site-specific DNA recombinase
MRAQVVSGEKRDKRLVVEPGEGAIVRRIFSDYAAGRSQRDIASALNAEGIRTASGVQWLQASIRVILKNPVYAGRVGHSETFDGLHEAIVDPLLWDQVAALREGNAKSRGGGRGRLPKNHLFVRGMLRCAKCGEAMRPRTTQRDNGLLHERYECSGRCDKRICDQGPVPRTTIDGAALRYFEQTALDVTATREQIRSATNAKLDEVEALRGQVERDQLQRTAQRSRIEADYLAGHLSAEKYERLDARLAEELEALSAQASRLVEQATQIREHARLYDAEDALLEQLTGVTSGRRGRGDARGRYRCAARRVRSRLRVLHL